MDENIENYTAKNLLIAMLALKNMILAMSDDEKADFQNMKEFSKHIMRLSYVALLVFYKVYLNKMDQKDLNRTDKKLNEFLDKKISLAELEIHWNDYYDGSNDTIFMGETVEELSEYILRLENDINGMTNDKKTEELQIERFGYIMGNLQSNIIRKFQDIYINSFNCNGNMEIFKQEMLNSLDEIYKINNTLELETQWNDNFDLQKWFKDKWR